MDIGKLFISQNGEPIEGYLSDNHQPKILIILKEPHTDDNLIFWFYRVVNNMEDFKEKSVRTGTGNNVIKLVTKQQTKESTEEHIGNGVLFLARKGHDK